MTQNTLSALRDLITFNLSSLDLILFNYQDDPFCPEPIKMALEDIKEGFQEALTLIAVPPRECSTAHSQERAQV